MKKFWLRYALAVFASMTMAAQVFLGRAAGAHCDTIDGPVVKDGRLSLKSGNPVPALKWVAAEQESELRAAFSQTRSVGSLSAGARNLADRYFLETLVRLHRLSEGEPYTGLKPSGGKLSPAVRMADHALQDGKVEPLIQLLSREVESGIRRRFRAALEAKHGSNRSVSEGRAFVAAYIEFVHYAEGIHGATLGEHDRHPEPEAHQPGRTQ